MREIHREREEEEEKEASRAFAFAQHMPDVLKNTLFETLLHASILYRRARHTERQIERPNDRRSVCE